MRPLIFGSPEDARFASAKTEMEAAGLRPVYRNPAFFKANELEKTDAIVVGEEAFYCAEIVAAFTAIEAKVTVLPRLVPDEDESDPDETQDEPAKETLLARATELAIAAPSILARWGVDRLAREIAKAEKE